MSTKSTSKNFSELLKALNDFEDTPDPAPRQRLLVKADVVRQARDGAKKAQQVPQRVLGEMIKSAVSDAVAAGRLSGDTAMRGLRALGLDNDGKAAPTGNSLAASLAGMSPDQQRAAVDHQVQLGKISGAAAVACLRELGLEP